MDTESITIIEKVQIKLYNKHINYEKLGCG